MAALRCAATGAALAALVALRRAAPRAAATVLPAVGGVISALLALAALKLRHHRMPAWPEALELIARHPDRIVPMPELGGTLYRPTHPSGAGIMFFPGGLVDARAYAPVLHRIADAGILVFCVDHDAYLRMPPLGVRLGMLSAVPGIAAAHPSVKAWVPVGHSLGGGSAAHALARYPAVFVRGLVLWGAHPPAGVLAPHAAALKGLRTLEIAASEDAIVPPAPPLRLAFAAAAEHHTIDGGNHAGYAAYGPQLFPRRDGEAAVPPAAQQAVAASRTAAFAAAFL